MPTFRRRGNQWECRIFSPHLKQQVSRSARSKRAARQLAEAYLRDLETGAAVPADHTTLGEFLALWLEQHAASVWTNTRTRYGYLARLHVVPYLGRTRLTKLQPLNLARLYTTLLTTGRRDGKPGGLHPRHVGHVHRMLHKALADAVAWGLVARNVADAVSPPKVPRTPVRPPSQAEARAVLALAKDAGIYAEIATAVATGMRPGELLALRWQDVDLDAGVAWVRQAVQRVPGEGLVFKDTKTHRSTRPVALPPFLVAVLRDQRAAIRQRRQTAGSAWQDEDLVFPTSQGTARDPRNFRRAFQAMLKKGGLAPRPLYELRHWFASLLLNAGAPLSVVSEAMGHAGIQVTKDVYGHISLGAQRRAVARLAPLFPEAPGRPSPAECRDRTQTVTRAKLEQGRFGETRLALWMAAQQVWEGGTPGGIRTPDPWFRRPVL